MFINLRLNNIFHVPIILCCGLLGKISVFLFSLGFVVKLFFNLLSCEPLVLPNCFLLLLLFQFFEIGFLFDFCLEFLGVLGLFLESFFSILSLFFFSTFIHFKGKSVFFCLFLSLLYSEFFNLFLVH